MATDERVDNAAQPYALACFRMAFGLLMLVAELRFIHRGWIQTFYVRPPFFFSFYGFDWVRPLPEPYIYWVFYALVGLSALIALGLFYRVAIGGFLVLFTYVELLDKSVYLNHYYQVSLLAFLMVWFPMNQVGSVDSWLRKKGWSFPSWPAGALVPYSARPHSVRELVYNPIWALRLQVGSVYFFGGIAKLNSDWLLRAQPLRIWLSASEHVPLVGPLLTERWVAYLLSWLAMGFDVSAPFLLCVRAARLPVFVVIVVFHLLTHYLFYIGLFPWMMMSTVLIFFPPTWFQRLWPGAPAGERARRPDERLPVVGQFSRRFVYGVLGIFFGLQFLLPFRSHAYAGNVLWHEQGFRFAWNIMLMEKNASLEYTVTVRKTGQNFVVRPGAFLTRIQARQMSFQPDMILQFAHYLHDYYLATGVGDTAIRAQCYASLNGRGSALLIDPTVDLTHEQDSFAPKPWINPL